MPFGALRAHEVVSSYEGLFVDYLIRLEARTFISEPRRAVCRQHSDPDTRDAGRIEMRNDRFDQLARNSLAAIF